MQRRSILFLVISMMAASIASAGTEMGTTPQSNDLYIGPVLGAAAVNNSGGTNSTYGLTFGYKFTSAWGAGLDYTYNTFTAPSPLTANLSLITANVRYYFTAVPGLYAHLKFGTGAVAVSGAGTPTSTNFTFGPGVGYDWAINTSWSVGAEGNVLAVNNTNPWVSVMQVLVQGKYWF